MNLRTAEPDSVGRRAWNGLLTVSQLLPGALDSAMRADGALTLFEFQVLDVLSTSTDRLLRLSALADSTHTSLPRLSHVITRLEKRGLVKRTACKDDRRATNAELTDAGHDALKRVLATENTACEEYLLNVLDPDQLAALAQISSLITGALKSDPDRPASHSKEQGE